MMEENPYNGNCENGLVELDFRGYKPMNQVKVSLREGGMSQMIFTGRSCPGENGKSFEGDVRRM